MRNGSADRVNFIWSVADLLRGDYKQSEYGKVILPLVIIRRLDCVLDPTKGKVLAEYAQLKGRISNVEPILLAASGESFYNSSPLTFEKLLDDPERIADNLRAYINGFSPGALEVITHFGFDAQVTTLDKAGLLYLVIGKFADIDLHPDVVSNHDMGYIFEELIRRFSEQSNETAGEHFTPREVIELMVNLLLASDQESLKVPGTRRTLYDPTAGTGGMLSVAETYLRKLNPDAQLIVFGQELNPESYAICRADMMLKGQDPTHIALGNTLTQDTFRNERFAYMLSNPPFGVDWKKYEKEIKAAKANEGPDGRFTAGLPRISDGSLMFLQHMMSKMRPVEEGGSRIAIVFNGSPLFTGDAGSGESEIRRSIIERDLLEAIVGLPDQLFYNTGIYTYFWVVTNRKSPKRKGKVQLIDGRRFFEKMPKSLGNKRNRLSEGHIRAITDLYLSFEDGECSRILSNEELGYRRVTIDRPLRIRYVVDASTVEAVQLRREFLGAESEEQIQLLAALREEIGLDADDASVAAKAIDRITHGLPNRLKKLVLSVLSVRDPSAPVVTDKKARPMADPELRDSESIPLLEDDDTYFNREVAPFVDDAWMDRTKVKVGYEVPFTRMFFRPAPRRSLDEVADELRALEAEVEGLLPKVLA